MTRPALALCAILCACHGQVTTYQAAPDSGSGGSAGDGGTTVPEAGADAGPECVAHDQCASLYYCNLVHGLCAPQDAAMCLVAGAVQDCGTGVCCILDVGGHECRSLSDCEPEGEAIP